MLIVPTSLVVGGLVILGKFPLERVGNCWSTGKADPLVGGSNILSGESFDNLFDKSMDNFLKVTIYIIKFFLLICTVVASLATLVVVIRYSYKIRT